MLELRNLCASYGTHRILSDLSLCLPRAEVTILLGRNGAGKSTLVSCINQLVPYTGQILWDGADLSRMVPRERAKRIALLPQILPRTALTVRELTMLGRNPYIGLGRRTSESDRAIVEKAMEDMDILPLADVPVSSLSGGERQNAFVAMILAQNTQLVILDEPTTYMDIDRRFRFRGIVENLKQVHGKTVLMITHDISEAMRVADHILLLEQSRLAFFGTPEECAAENVIENVFSVRKHVFTENGETFVIYE